MRRKPPFTTLKLWLIGALYIIRNVTAQAVIQSDTIVNGNNPSGYENGYIVLGGAYLAFQDMNSVPMYQTVRVDKGGALYYVNNNMKGFSISSAHAFTVPFVFRNEGTVVVDDRHSTSPGSWTVNSGTFTNTGNMMFTSSQGDTIGIYASSITNTGVIYSKGTSSSKPQQLKISSGNSWINTGTICLANSTYKLSKSIQGGGCISVGEGSVFNIYSYDMQQQTIYLSHPSSVVSFSNGQNVAVHGLGNGNGFLYPGAPIQKVTYNSLTGIATFTTGIASLQQFTVPIGLGYNQSEFEIIKSINIQGTNYNNYNYVIYTGPPPNSAPSVCQPCVEIPLFTFKVPEAYETTNDIGFTETVSFFSTYNSNNLPMIGTTTIYSPPNVYTLTRYNESTTETDIVSKVTGVDFNGSPFAYYTTITVKGKQQPEVVTKTITITNDDGSKSTITTVQSNNDTINSSTSSVPSASVETISSIDGEGMEVTDIISPIITTNSDGKPTTIFTTYPYDDGVDKTVIYTNGDALPTTVIISHITTTGANGQLTTIATTYPRLPNEGPDYTTTTTNSQGQVITEIISHITTEDENGQPTIIITTIKSSKETDDYTTVVTNADGSVETDIVSHITTTDSDGKPTTIVTTFPAPAASGADYTTVVTNADGSVETDIVSHIPTKDSIGKPTTVVTTVPYTLCASNADYTTVVTKSNVSVETEVVSHITTTAPCSDLESHVESQTTSPSMHTTSLVGSENGVSAKTVNDKPNPTSVTEVAVSEGTTSNAGYVTDQGSSLEMFAPTGASAVESGNKVSQTQTASIFHGAGSTFKIKFNTILLSTSLTILILLGMA